MTHVERSFERGGENCLGFLGSKERASCTAPPALIQSLATPSHSLILLLVSTLHRTHENEREREREGERERERNTVLMPENDKKRCFQDFGSEFERSECEFITGITRNTNNE
jgi:hypothetical protein